MGTDFSLACADCKEFIGLHKWPISDAIANAIFSAYGLPGELSKTFHAQRDNSFSSQPFIRVSSGFLLAALAAEQPNQEYIEILIKHCSSFCSQHKEHFLFITSDLGPEPWDPGEPQQFAWKEIRGAFFHTAPFLPRNLIDDYRFTTWGQVVELYENEEHWILHDQMSEDLSMIHTAFEKLSKPK
jgi:hypothetical protein